MLAFGVDRQFGNQCLGIDRPALIVRTFPVPYLVAQDIELVAHGREKFRLLSTIFEHPIARRTNGPSAFGRHSVSSALRADI
jgi:hypothetical protein